MYFSTVSTGLIALLAILSFGGATLRQQPQHYHHVDINIPKQPLKILYLTLPAMGHLNSVLSLANELASRGHNVTVCLGIDDDISPKLEELIRQNHAKYHHFESSLHKIATKDENENLGIFDVAHVLSEYFNKMILSLNESLSNGAYDIVLGDDFLTTTLLCINSRWQIPGVIVGSTTNVFIHQQPSWPWPGLLLGTSSDNLSFFQRMVSSIEKVFLKKILDRLIISPQVSALQDFCPSVTLEEFSTSPGVYLPHIVPTVIGFEYPRTLSPLTEYVGPLISKNPIPLSKEVLLNKWLDSKPDKSVVYVSMGSRSGLSLENGRAILEGVMQTNYSLLWSLKKSSQWILDDIKVDPERVFVSGWTPQFSVLASNAIHSAILHGGFGGLSEALWNGVPVIGFPQMTEQVLNVGRLYHNNLGLRLDANTLSSSNVAKAVARLDDGDYHLRVQKLQKMYKFAGGVDRAADLVEYYEDVGYAHLVPAYAKYQWSWIQYYNADVWLVIVSVVLLLLFLTIKLLTTLIKCCYRIKIKRKAD